jgi:transcriptional regulator with PAS, ATPase and Fis domain
VLSQTEPTSRPRGGGRGSLRLVVTYAVSEPLVGTARFLTSGLELGRGPSGESPLTIDDSEMSRRHAVIEGTTEQPSVRDLGSRNGTWLNGGRVEGSAPLAHGDLLRVGSTLLLIELVRPDQVMLVATPPPRSGRILGQSLALLEALARAHSFAALPVPVLLLGESGVGKELFAHEIHEASLRTGPFVPVNCAAIPENVAESELFGHERGAFTGAERKSDGLFGEAEGGTLFLDELGEMPLMLQAKLLRALGTGEVRAVGSTRARTIDVRVIAATNVKLDAAIEGGSFRGDLYARLAGGIVEIPPLRERLGDVLRLAREMLVRGSDGRRRAGSIAEAFTPDAAEALSLHRWPFNVRELEQQMRLAGRLGGAGPIELAQLPPMLRLPFDVRSGQTTEVSRKDLALLNIAADRVPSREELEQVLAHFEGNVSQAAGFFGKDRRQLYRWAERHGMELGERRG